MRRLWVPATGAVAVLVFLLTTATAQDISISGAKSAPVDIKEAPLPGPPPSAAPAGPSPTGGIPLQTIERKSGMTVEQAAPKTGEAVKTGQSMVLNFENTPIREVIRNVCEMLNMNYIVEQDIKGFVTIRTLNKVPVASALDLLDQLLVLNGLTRVKIGNYWRFLPLSTALKEPLPVYKDAPATEFVARDRFMIQVLTFNYVGADQAVEIFRPFLSKEATVTVLPRSNMAIVVERGTKMQEIVSLVQAIDVDTLDAMQVKLLELKSANAVEVAAELVSIFNAMGYVKSTPGTGILFLPVDRLNAILMVNPFPNLYPTVKSWVEKLDISGSGSTEVVTNIYHVQHGDAENLANLLRQIYVEDATKRKTAGVVSSMVEGPLLILSHLDTNTIIIRTAERNFQVILETLKKLDHMPQQVLIEVLITELKLTDDLKFGLEWALQSQNGQTSTSAAMNLGGLSPSTGGSVSTNLNNAAFNPVGAAQGLTVFTRPNTDIMGLLQALAAESKLDVRASPILMTMENKAASLEITNEIPISTITTTSTGATAQNIQYRSVGIRLSVTPKINIEKFVSLAVDQEISQIDDSRAAQFKDAVPLLRRQARTSVVVRDRQTLVLGGMINEQNSGGRSGIPLLSKIPLLGWLFGTTTKSENKTELLILLTPHVVSSEEEAKVITDEYKKQIMGLEQSAKSGKAKEAKTPVEKTLN